MKNIIIIPLFVFLRTRLEENFFFVLTSIRDICRLCSRFSHKNYHHLKLVVMCHVSFIFFIYLVGRKVHKLLIHNTSIYCSPSSQKNHNIKCTIRYQSHVVVMMQSFNPTTDCKIALMT